MRILVTGGAGFIGSNFIRRLLQSRPDVDVVNLDGLTYAGNLENLKEAASNQRYRFVRGDITDRGLLDRFFDERPDAIVNFAAESHVDRSILDSQAFISTNVMGTQALLELARGLKSARFLQVSTDEVYGSLGKSGQFAEESPLAPNSPYAASKAAADLLVRAYRKTYRLDAIVTRCGNNYGPFQFPEKLIPLMILNAIEDKPLPVYGDGLQRRDWIHVDDHCRALEKILFEGQPGRTYNVGANQERPNLEVVSAILRILGKPDDLIEHVPDRPGHDRRYSVDASRLRAELGWQPQVDFEQGLASTIAWYQANRDWVDHVRSGEYREYYARMYERRSSTLAEL